MQKQEQQTAVEWYDNQLHKVFSNTTEASNFSHEELLQQAREMEKERMIEFGELCWKNLLRSDVIMRPRDVYNETYGGNK
jgi:hypothetical protein